MKKSIFILISLLLISLFPFAGNEPVLASGTCQSMETIGCGGVDSASTAGFVNNITTYNCAPTWNESGPEYVYSFVPQGDGQVTVTLSLEIADLDVFVLEGTCSQDSCIAYGDSSATFGAVTGTQYYIVVDGYAGGSGSFTLAITCSGLCGAMENISCGQIDTGNTQGLSNNITTYNCAPTWNESGPEYIYSFVPQSKGQVTATLSNMYADLDVFVLEGTCSQDSCIAYGDSSATFNAVSGTQYYIVVDGFSGESGTFTLEIICSNVCNVKLAGDINGDCYVNFTDMALLANNWLKCNNAMDAGCTGN